MKKILIGFSMLLGFGSCRKTDPVLELGHEGKGIIVWKDDGKGFESRGDGFL